MRESIQDMPLKLALQMARDDFEDQRERQPLRIDRAKTIGEYAGRQADTATHDHKVPSARRCPPQGINRPHAIKPDKAVT